MAALRITLPLATILATMVSAHSTNAIHEYKLHHHGGDQPEGSDQPEGVIEGHIHDAEPEAKAESSHFEQHMHAEEYLDTSQMTESEKQYHYFLAHDYDNDEQLDGTEIMQSFFHGENAQIYKEEELTHKIDYLMDEFDSDRNGKLSFAEFMLSTARFTG